MNSARRVFEFPPRLIDRLQFVQVLHQIVQLISDLRHLLLLLVRLLILFCLGDHHRPLPLVHVTLSPEHELGRWVVSFPLLSLINSPLNRVFIHVLWRLSRRLIAAPLRLDIFLQVHLEDLVLLRERIQNTPGYFGPRPLSGHLLVILDQLCLFVDEGGEFVRELVGVLGAFILYLPLIRRLTISFRVRRWRCFAFLRLFFFNSVDIIVISSTGNHFLVLQELFEVIVVVNQNLVVEQVRPHPLLPLNCCAQALCRPSNDFSTVRVHQLILSFRVLVRHNSRMPHEILKRARHPERLTNLPVVNRLRQLSFPTLLQKFSLLQLVCRHQNFYL